MPRGFGIKLLLLRVHPGSSPAPRPAQRPAPTSKDRPPWHLSFQTEAGASTKCEKACASPAMTACSRSGSWSKKAHSAVRSRRVLRRPHTLVPSMPRVLPFRRQHREPIGIDAETISRSRPKIFARTGCHEEPALRELRHQPGKTEAHLPRLASPAAANRENADRLP